MNSPLDRVLSGLQAASLGQPLSPAVAKLTEVDAASFWAALKEPLVEGSSGGTSVLPVLPQRSKSVCLAGKVCSEGKLVARRGSTNERLPPLSRSASGGTTAAPAPTTAHSPARARAATNRIPRTRSMFVLPASAAYTSGRISSLSSNPGGGDIGTPSTGTLSPLQLTELCRGTASLGLFDPRVRPVIESCPGERRSSRDGSLGYGASGSNSISGSPGQADLLPVPEGDEEVLALRGSLTARCATAVQTWKSIDDFASLRLIASGRNSTVWEAVPKKPLPPRPGLGIASQVAVGSLARDSSDASVVVKACCTAKLGRRALQGMLLEQRVLQEVHHPHIIRGLGSFSEDGHIFLVMEFAAGRNVKQFLQYWQHRNQEDFEGGSETTVVPEGEAAQLVVGPLLAALEHLHGQGIVHRDVKPENAVFTQEGTLRLIDFGLSQDIRSSSEPPSCQVGTLTYRAPELLGDALPLLCQLDRSDCWAVGVLAYQLLVGELPFYHEVPALLQHLIMEADMPYQMLEVMGASPAAIDFVRQALTKDPMQRPTAAQLRAHPWLLQYNSGQAQEPCEFAA